MKTRMVALVCLPGILLAAAGTALAGEKIIIETVPVENPGNAGELSGFGAGGYGEDRICGAVAYDFSIGKYEVTAGEYTAFLNAVAGTDTYRLYHNGMALTGPGSGITRSGSPGGYTYSVDSAHENRPVNYVSWGDAARFANWLHNGQPTGAQDLTTTEDGAYYLNGATTDAALLAVSREADWKWAITSEDEWYKAAYYNPATSSYFDYPTSSNSLPGRDPDDASGNNANRYGNPYPIQSPYYTTLAGEFQNSDSPYGTFDQGGNVGEWTEAVLYGKERGLRGGSFGSGDLGAAWRGYDYPTEQMPYIGFRVSEVPEPASMAVLVLGGIGVLLMRRGAGK